MEWIEIQSSVEKDLRNNNLVAHTRGSTGNVSTLPGGCGEPSILFGDATCPNCGQLLWFMQFSEVASFFEPRSLPSKDRILDIIANQLGIDRDRIVNNPNLLNEIGVDSLDTVELVMAIEEEFDN